MDCMVHGLQTDTTERLSLSMDGRILVTVLLLTTIITPKPLGSHVLYPVTFQVFFKQVFSLVIMYLKMAPNDSRLLECTLLE